ncbi:hypothetical protein PSI9734_01587 [Pseudidiomarina piscicola]|uniref:General secretion pathway protein M n=1 Tax=Pseudidiomarina piscicola TaxID=2614830 RepID=A0A6S6WNV5_9GAMM|nr:hypothetical protein [Pseudidiomarina piscicola]CAB0151174.1 hypothetical protein PSI9734_01587 [Pseudidiomarina piscicola]VZT40680.1 hypothetical protein PSI9734_01587 [Pseudomonas aeruginosa]
MTDNQRTLLIVAVFLAAVQFIVKPIVNWQNQVATELALTHGQVQRSEQLLAHAEQVRKAHQNAIEQQQTLIEGMPSAAETTLLQIQLQDRLATLLRKQDIAIDEFNWVTGAQPQTNAISTLNAKVKLAGNIEALAQAQFALMQELPFVQHQSIELRPSQRRRGNNYELTFLLQVAVRQPGGGS